MPSGDGPAFYATVAASSAAMFGIGTAILAGRFLALAERVAQLRLERGDHLNDLSGHISVGWKERARRDAIADIHEMALNLRPWVAIPLLLTVFLVVASVLPLAGLPLDRGWFRAGLVVLLIVTSAVWVGLLWQLLSNLVGVTSAEWGQRKRQEDARRAEGAGFLVSGHRDDLADGIENAFRFIAPQYLRSRKGKRWLRRVRRRRPPQV